MDFHQLCLGTTDITSTVDMLDSLYNELEIFQSWTSKPKSGPPGKAEQKYVNERQKDFTPRPDFIKCTREKCNSTRHTAAECYLLHPELRPDFRKMKDQKKNAFKAQVDNLTEDMSMSEASVASLVEQVALLKAELA